uniref:hypothetical protein n=1 Tax=uncultured Psychrobacter sp. TaxID=259303 RepID=UPI0025948B6A|nr:hypothetical protein [uncultured Psychrobacter sp.]
MKCSYDGCNNKVFKSLDKCALHCVKSGYQVDRHNGLLSEFNTLLKDIVIDDILKEAKKGEEPYINLIIKFINRRVSYQELEEKSRKIEADYKGDIVPNNILSNKLLIFNGINFPERDSRDPFDYMKWLVYIGNIHFHKCIFYLSYLYFENTKVFFDECIFKKYFCFYPAKLLENAYDTVFSHCIFTEEVSVAPSGDRPKDNIYKHRVFYNCEYSKGVTIRDCKFEAEVFYQEKDDDKYHSNKIDVLEVKNCIFDEKLKINNFKISSLLIEDTIFNLKLEIKESIISVISFKNSNVEKVFDAFGSRFNEACFYKSIFEDFAGFEKVVFGVKGKDTEEYQAKFTYTTFMSFSNFRSTKFLSGLDFENSNLKEQPNFLKTIINPKNTNRETFRIIKKSFDDVGNQLEANRFFVEEMNAYSKELIASDGNYSEKIVFFTNYITSSFGRSYIRPFLLLVLSLCFYVGSYEFYAAWYQSNIYILPEPIHTIAKYLNDGAKSFLPFSRFIQERKGFEFVSLIFYVLFAILTWQIIVAVKRHTQR